MKYILLKSKDDYSFEHYALSPLSKLTGFVGTAGEGLQDENGHITLFVDPRYHIQADIQTKNRDVSVVKMTGQYGLITYFNDFLPKNSTLLIPEKSVSYGLYKNLKENLKCIKIETYKTEEDCSSIDNNDAPVFEVEKNVAGKTFFEKLKKLDLKNYLVVNLEEIAYLLNLRSYKTKNTSLFRSKLFIKSKDEAILFTDYEIPIKDDKIKVKKMSEYEGYIKKQTASISVDINSISLYDYNLIKNINLVSENKIAHMASVKNTQEINHYKASFKRLDAALYDFRNQIKEGLSEFELNEIFEKALIKNGAKTTSFKTILAIDENSGIIHYTANSKEKILKNGSLILLDCGGYYEGGYATDITRVFALGDVDDEVKKIYTAVLKAQLNVYHSKFLMTDEFDNLAKKILKKYEKENFSFPHGLGHGIGIPVHQAPPTLSNKFKIKIKKGNVFTIEPGLYAEGKFGIRLENTVYFDGKNKISLSKFPYEEKMINYDMLNKEEKKWLLEWQNQEKWD